ncbi:MAG: hypothetical protein QM527_07115 [Alphaproteobacteria bacterium]|nr:hypothetical protein [Alphaproteobacteria bacterium]
MKNLTVRLSDLDHKRLTEQAIKKGGTVSDAMRDIVSQFFDKQSQTQNDKAEHEKTRAKFADIDNALANQVADFQALKADGEKTQNLVIQLGRMFGEFVATVGASKK